MTNPEKQNENLDEKNFEKAFEKEMWKWWENFDKKSFSEIVSWNRFDKNLSKEDNFKKAFNSKIDWMINKNLRNLPPDKLAELKSLQKKSNEWKSLQELIENYKEIKETIWTRHAESKKWENDKQNQDNKQQQEKASKNSKEFIDKLLESIKESQEIERKAKKEIEIHQTKLAKEQEWELKIAEAWIEKL